MTARGTTFLLSLAAALGLAGCGGSAGSSSQSTQAAAPGAKPAAAFASVTPAHSAESAHTQFVGFARDVNLRPQDVTGFVAKAEHSGQGPQLARSLTDKPRYERCLDTGKEAPPLFKASSATFQAKDGALGVLSAKSEVHVIRTRAAAEKELTATLHELQDPAKLRCFTSAFDAMLGGSHVTRTDGHTVKITIGKVRAVPVQLASAAAGTNGAYGLSLSVPVTYAFTVKGHAITVPGALSIDLLNFILGRAGVGLTTMAFGAPFPPAREASLFSLLVARAVRASRQVPAVSE